MKIVTEPYTDQIDLWPSTGRHILAQYDDDTIIVYQAYCSAIGSYAIRHGQFGDGFSFNRMSWVKPNFLWMMYRSGWGTKQNQEITLGLRISRTFFEQILGYAVPSSWDHDLYSTREAWQKALAGSSVRLQWDPDHNPSGAPQQRRAIQLGLRGDVLQAFATHELMEVIDLTEFVRIQREQMMARNTPSIVMPRERTYIPSNKELALQLRLGGGDGMNGDGA